MNAELLKPGLLKTLKFICHVHFKFAHVFVTNDPIKSNLTPTYDGLFEVRSRTDKTFFVIRRDKLQSVSINNVKPACILSPLPDCVNPNASDLSVNLRQNR